MRCPHCEETAIVERRERTELGDRRFRCYTCHREFNERTGTRFNHLQDPTDPSVSCCGGALQTQPPGSGGNGPRAGPDLYARSRAGWEAHLAPLLSDTLRKHRRGRSAELVCGQTYIKVKGRWTYLYRAIDRKGNLVDVC
jgi:hypothetical protein